MGREIRMVPPHWEHPRFTEDNALRREDVGEYRACYDEVYEDEADKWVADCVLWAEGKHPNQSERYRYYWEYASVPDEMTCRPRFTEEPTWFQAYQTVSEGTPTTPPFATREELVDYLVENGDFSHQRYPNDFQKPSRSAATAFVNSGYAPSMMVVGGAVLDSYEAAELGTK